MNNPNPFRPDVPDVLVKICADKAEWVANKKRQVSISDLEARAQDHDRRGFKKALVDKHAIGDLALIAEIKKASPSAGMIRPDFDPSLLAMTYAAAGATCLSVLTDVPYFQGDDAYVPAARVSCDLPVLRKDFMVDTYQVAEAAAMGADCILVIVGALEDSVCLELIDAAKSLSLDVLVEVHDQAEMARACTYPDWVMLGVNNRDLRKMTTDLATFEHLAPMANPGQLLVAESGLKTHQDMLRMQKAGAGAYLVGESLMKQPDVEVATRTLLGTT